MDWVAGLRSGTLYTVKQRPLDPRWSKQDLHVLLGWCASAQALGWTEQKSFQVAEAIIFEKKHGVSCQALFDDMNLLLISGEKHQTQ